jgi:pimeloyl-ACP methyl ester carboxylesterase
MIPLWFGTPARFGQLHAAVGESRDCGVVLCNPLGYEALCTHRSYFDLAELLAGAGFSVLRFDYAGSGDSAGSDDEPDRVPAWLESISLAADELKRHTGVSRLAFFGLRLGATLALTAAASRDDVMAIIAWAPVLKGKAYVRELRAFGLIKGERSPGASLEAAGFMLTTQTIEAIGTLDVLVSEKTPPRALVLSKDATLAEDRLHQHLQALGAKSEHVFVPGYDTMMRDAHDSKVPDEVWSRIISWLMMAFPKVGVQSLKLEPKPAASFIADGMSEHLFRFGANKGLFGVLSEPLAARAKGLAVLLLNTGSNHHVGPHRMAVTLARALATRGLPSFRFDIAGLGDSTTGPGGLENRLYSHDSIADVQAAMAMLQVERGFTRFALVGLCSGAYLTYQTAKADDRVVGQVLINLQTFSWHPGDSLEVSLRQSYKSTQFYRSALLRPEVWSKLMRGQVNVSGIALKLVDRVRRRSLSRVASVGRFIRHGTSDTEVARTFKALDARGVQTLLVYGSNDGGLDTIAEHLGPEANDMKRRKGFACVILEGADHTFTERAKREVLIDTITSHLAARFTR